MGHLEEAGPGDCRSYTSAAYSGEDVWPGSEGIVVERESGNGANGGKQKWARTRRFLDLADQLIRVRRYQTVRGSYRDDWLSHSGREDGAVSGGEHEDRAVIVRESNRTFLIKVGGFIIALAAVLYGAAANVTKLDTLVGQMSEVRLQLEKFQGEMRAVATNLGEGRVENRMAIQANRDRLGRVEDRLSIIERTLQEEVGRHSPR